MCIARAADSVLLTREGFGQDDFGKRPSNLIGRHNMINQTKIAVALAIVLGTASGAAAATKHPVHHNRTAVHQVTKGAYESFGAATGTTSQQPLGYDPWDATTVRCIGGTCAPMWGQADGSD
jgi:hypothetical protein